MKEIKPPILADKFLSWFCKDELLEEIQGDLYEYFERISINENRFRTSVRYWFHVFHFLRPFAIRKFKGQSLIYTTMFKSNLVIALRNLSKYKFYSGLNISGLALGLCCCIFIIIWTTDEMSYDTFFEDHERIYRVSSDLKFQDNKYDMALTPAPMAEAFKADFPEILHSGRLRNGGSSVFKKGDRFVDQHNLMYADHDIFEIFSFEFIYGDRQTVLTEPNSIVITESVARRFFDSNDVVGKSLVNINNDPFKIDGVIRDLPTNSHFHPEVLISMEGFDQSRDGVWLSNNFYTYFLLDENNNATALEAKFESVYPKYFGPQLEQFVGATWDQLIQSGSHVNYFLVKLNDIHLHSHQDHEIEANGDIEYVFMFSAIGIFILVIACINFMNLSTARAAVRSKEVGIRKVLGSFRHQLIGQFLLESVIASFIALIMALALIILLLPLFEGLTGKVIENPMIMEMSLWLSIGLGTLVIGLLAGIYPAFVLSGYKPVMVLKGQLRSGKTGSAVRGVLVVFQFVMSIIMIVGTTVVYKQLNFIQNQNLGFDKERVIILNNTFTLGTKITSFKEELLRDPQIENITITGYLPTNDWRSDTALQPKEATNTDNTVGCQIWSVDHDYIKTMGMKIVAGRDFSKELISDSTSVLLNETAAKRFGFDNPIGKKIKTLGDFQFYGMNEVTVVGVVEDFHFDSMRDNIAPMLILLSENSSVIAIRYLGNDVNNVLASVENVWNEFNPNHPLDYDFMDRQFDAKYEAEMQLGQIFTVFGILAIIIACLGLFGLSAFTAEQRRKEIGIRKVLGASVSNLIQLLFSGYTRLLVISLIIGLPAAFMAMNSWLEDFAYHTEIGFGVMILSAMVALLIAWLTVTYQSLRAARLNPAENLRAE